MCCCHMTVCHSVGDMASRVSWTFTTSHFNSTRLSLYVGFMDFVDCFRFSFNFPLVGSIVVSGEHFACVPMS